MTKICKKCGSENPDSSTFCKDCGNKLIEHQAEDNKHIIIIGALAIVAALLVVALLFMGGFLGHGEIPLENHDFGGISMLVPEGSDYVETRSMPSYGVIGGFLVLENAGDYSKEAFSIIFSTTMGSSHPSEVVLDRREGDITIYKDAEGRDGLYMVRQVDDVEVTLIGNDEETMIKMLNSVKLTGDFSEDGQTTTSSTLSSSTSSESGSWVSIGSYSGSGSGSKTVTVPEGKIMVKLSAYPIKNYATNHLYVSGSNGESGGVDWGSSSAVETRSDSFTYSSTSSETFTIDYYETVSWEVEFFKYQ